VGYSVIDYLREKRRLDTPFLNQPNWKIWTFVLVVVIIMVGVLPPFLAQIILITTLIAFVVEYLRYRSSRTR